MFGSKQKGDSRIRNILTSADIKYEVDNDGDYKVIFKFDDGRTQLNTVRLSLLLREIAIAETEN